MDIKYSQWVIEEAKKSLLVYGGAPPCIFVGYNQSEQTILDISDFLGAKNELDGSSEYARVTFFIGRFFANEVYKKNKECDVTSASLIAWVWYVPTKDPGTYIALPRDRPCKHPQRKDVLIITTIDAATMEQKVQGYDILQVGSTLDLLEGESMTAVSATLPCFLAGVRTAKQDQSLAIHELRHIYERYNTQVQERFLS